MQLQHVGRHRGDDLVEEGIVGVNRDGDRFGPIPRRLPQATGLLRRNVARAFREEDEADLRGAAGKGGFERFRRLQAADFYVHERQIVLAAPRVEKEPPHPSLETDRLQRSAIALQPCLAAFRAGTELFAQLPELRTVVHLLQVRDLVGNEIVEHGGRRHHDAP